MRAEVRQKKTQRLRIPGALAKWYFSGAGSRIFDRRKNPRVEKRFAQIPQHAPSSSITVLTAHTHTVRTLYTHIHDRLFVSREKKRKKNNAVASFSTVCERFIVPQAVFSPNPVAASFSPAAALIAGEQNQKAI